MPLYNYRCEDCDWEAKVLSTIKKREDQIQCASCQGKAKYVIGTPGLVVGREPFHKSARTLKKERLARRETRLNQMPKEQADDFRRLSKNITGGEF